MQCELDEPGHKEEHAGAGNDQPEQAPSRAGRCWITPQLESECEDGDHQPPETRQDWVRPREGTLMRPSPIGVDGDQEQYEEYQGHKVGDQSERPEILRGIGIGTLRWHSGHLPSPLLTEQACEVAPSYGHALS